MTTSQIKACYYSVPDRNVVQSRQVSRYKLFFLETFKSLQKLPGQLNKAVAFGLNFVHITQLQSSSQTTISFPQKRAAAGEQCWAGQQPTTTARGSARDGDPPPRSPRHAGVSPASSPCPQWRAAPCPDLLPRHQHLRGCRLQVAQTENGTVLPECGKPATRKLYVLLEVKKKEEKAFVLCMHRAAHVCTLRVISVAEVTSNYNVSEMAWFPVDSKLTTISFLYYQMGCIMWKINYKTLPRVA